MTFYTASENCDACFNRSLLDFAAQNMVLRLRRRHNYAGQAVLHVKGPSRDLVAHLVAEVVKTFEKAGRLETLDEFRYVAKYRDSIASH